MKIDLNQDIADLIRDIDEIFDDYVFGNIDMRKLKKKEVKCECGADKVKTTHSTWCPKYEKR